MKRLILMVGLPRSGKSTRALELSKKLGAPIVNPDSVRLVIHGDRYRQEAEPVVWGVVKTMVSALFEAGHEEVIIDACNNTRKRRAEWLYGNWEIVFEVVQTPVNICRERAPKDDRIQPIIDRMASMHEPVSEDEGPLYSTRSE